MNVFAMKKSCSSKASSISATSEESHEIVTKTKKMKEKAVEGSQLKQDESSSAGVLLDLKVHNNYNINTNCSNLELKLFNSTPARASESSNEATPKQRCSSDTRTFSCSFCKREFSTSQALGDTRTLTNKSELWLKDEMDLLMLFRLFGPPNYHPYCNPYSSFNSHIPFHRDSSMIHKPTSYPTWPFFWGYNFRLNPEKWSSSSSSSSFFRTQNVLGNNILGASLENSHFENKNNAKGFNLMNSPINLDDSLDGNNHTKIGLGKEEAKKNNEEEETKLDLNLRL
ncbi:hypothetical protein R3W88_000029 [Solanum pinnatisectum]|uniref:Uncharacterized protein n=1 Tax=Solanum pinnatisectum TaxID=50273 RepID=A0AAV9MHX7_9SOLN|nr:hypothetical protein R3W88_000029 [Solanum pinnatisectum]